MPPLLTALYRRLRYGAQAVAYGHFGNYSSWHEALIDSEGYDGEAIFDKVFRALLLVRDKKAVYERDSVLFDEIQYSWPLLSALLWIAAQKELKLNIVDFGGSLGSSYYQNIGALSVLKEVKWNIIEQPKFVECGKKHFENAQMKFYYDMDSCMESEKSEAILLSSVVQYLDDSYAMLDGIIRKNFEFIIIDRTLFFDDEDRITVQRVSPSIYEASYPCRIFNRRNFLQYFSKDYDLIFNFEALGGKVFIEGTAACYEGYVFKKRTATKD